MGISTDRWISRFLALAITWTMGTAVVAKSSSIEGQSDNTARRFAADDAVVASVVGHSISRRELEQRWQSIDAAGFARVQQQLHDAYARALDALIADYLLADDADRQGLTVGELLNRLGADVEQPTTAEIRETFDRSSAAEQGIAFEAASPVISSYLIQQKTAAARQRYVDELRRSAPPDIRLPLESWRQTVTVAHDDPRAGSEGAPVEIVEFSDFQCPYCKRAAPVLKQVLAKFPNEIKLIWRDFPLPMHQAARPAAEAAQCANDQGRFWEYHDVLFANQDALTESDLKKHALSTGLQLDRFARCFESGKFRRKIDAGIQEGNRLGIGATPTVFINGRMVTGAVPFEAYERVVREELARLPRRTP